MSQKEQPVISAYHGDDSFTKVTFYPDLRKFKMEEFEADMVSLFTKRAYDLAGITDSRVSVVFNGKYIKVKNFEQYCDLYLSNRENEDLPKIVEKK